MSSARPIPSVNPGDFLDLPPEDIAPAIEQLGVLNGQPPVVHASHLKNKRTGVVLPWNALLAEQRDLMEPCDSTGNTDPTAWEPTVIEGDDADEQERLYWAARNSVVQQAQQMADQYKASAHASTIPTINGAVGADAQPLDAYYDGLEAGMASIMRRLAH